MATAHRTISNLPTLRCSVGFRNRRPVLLTQGFVGADSVTEQEVSELEIPNQPGVTPPERMKARRKFIERIVNDADHPVARQIAVLHQNALPKFPLWLQISQDSAEAALMRWEGAIHRLTDRGTLRIPNFLKNPFLPGPVKKIAICASEPRAKGNWNLPKEIQKLLQALKSALSIGYSRTEITLFLPREKQFSEGALNSYLETLATLFEGHDFTLNLATVADASLEPSPQTRAISRSTDVTNPWLLWIMNHYGPTGVAAVHFICPGYTSNNQGALALAESPTQNIDANWARFVGQDELMSFYDAVGASIIGFTALGSDRWTEGIHRLAYALSWLRPGAVYTIDPLETDKGLPALLRGIHSEFGLDLGAPSTTSAYAYPAMLEAPTGYAEPTSGADTDFFAPHPEVEEVLGFRARSRPPDLYDPEDTLGNTGHYWESLSNGELDFAGVPLPDGALDSALERQAQLQRFIAAERARGSSVKARSPLEQARDKGTQAALDFIEEIMTR